MIHRVKVNLMSNVYSTQLSLLGVQLYLNPSSIYQEERESLNAK